MTTAIEAETWISYAEAQRRLAVGRNALLTLIGQGRLSSRAVPGSRPAVLANEVDELAETSTRRANGAAKTEAAWSA